jgi:hypothetical protein
MFMAIPISRTDFYFGTFIVVSLCFFERFQSCIASLCTMFFKVIFMAYYYYLLFHIKIVSGGKALFFYNETT